jgi:assimilatory nitrate reductase catalytic subunit
VEYRLATSLGPLFWHDFAYRWLGPDARLAEQLDGSVYRAAGFLDGHLEGCVCVAPAQAVPQWDLAGLAAAAAEGGERRIPKNESRDYYIGETEPVVCACFQVRLDAVRKAVNSGGATSVGDIGRTLRAGTNCGSCLPELKRIIVDERIAHSL